jgi:hypothetical protein
MRLFTYGTLKRGHQLHGHLAAQSYLGDAQTLPEFRLLNCGWYPALVESSGDRRAKRTHFGKLIGVENGPTVVVSGDFESFRFRALGVKDAYGGRLRTDQACSS